MLETLLPASFDWWHIPTLFVAVLIGEGFGAIIGGGSIVTLPALLLTGLPLTSAIAIDNAMALGTEAGILTETHREARRRWRLVVFMFVPLMLGGVVGTWLLLTSSAEFIKPIMVLAVIYLLLQSYLLKGMKIRRTLDKLKYPIMFLFLLLIGVYNNFIGVGEGTFARLGLMLILGMTFIQSQGIKTIATIPIRAYSLVLTAFAGLIVWPYLITMWIAAFIAGKYATKAAKNIPEKYMRYALSFIAVGFLFYLVFVL